MMYMNDRRVPTEKELMKQRSKLVLWYTRDCKPLFTRNDLVPIMANLGFVPLPLSVTKITIFHEIRVSWMECKYCGASAITTGAGAFRSHPRLRIKKPPTPRLPYPYIDGLHLYTYRAFFEAVNFYLINGCFDVIFHFRGIPAHIDYPKLCRWHYSDEIGTIFRLGTLDPELSDLYSDDIAYFMPVEIFPVKEDYIVDYDTEITEAAVNDIIVTDHQNNNSSQDHEGTEEDEYGMCSGSESSIHSIWNI